MVMMLPFLTGAIAVWYALRGRRHASLWAWTLTLLVFAAWCRFHMTDPLGLSL